MNRFASSEIISQAHIPLVLKPMSFSTWLTPRAENYDCARKKFERNFMALFFPAAPLDKWAASPKIGFWVFACALKKRDPAEPRASSGLAPSEKLLRVIFTFHPRKMYD